jgi:tetratricopeptide (TPR) repeat protein
MRRIFWLIFIVPLLVFSQAESYKAEKLFRQGNYAEARVIFEKMLRENPGNLTAIEYLGDIRGVGREWEAAVGYYETLKNMRPNNAEYQYKYGGALAMFAKECNKFRALGMIPDIRKSFEKAIALDPSHINARWALIELYLQLPGIIGGSESKATQYADELLKISPVDGFLAKGRIAEYFERFATAERYYKKAVQAGGSKTTYQKLADLYKNKMNQPEKARATLAEFSAKNKS